MAQCLCAARRFQWTAYPLPAGGGVLVRPWRTVRGGRRPPQPSGASWRAWDMLHQAPAGGRPDAGGGGSGTSLPGVGTLVDASRWDLMLIWAGAVVLPVGAVSVALPADALA